MTVDRWKFKSNGFVLKQLKPHSFRCNMLKTDFNDDYLIWQ